MKLSLSVNWCNRRIESGEEIADTAAALGFDELEIGFRTTASQVEGIRRYVIVKGMRSLPPALQEIAQKRLDNADLSLVELGQLFEPPLSKSAVNHRMRRLMDIVREHEAQLIQEFSEAQEEEP